MANTKAYIITGPTSGIGYHTALQLAGHGTVILVGRNQDKLNRVKQTITAKGHDAITVLCDLADIRNVRQAAQPIMDLQLPIAGLLNNAGITPANQPKARRAGTLPSPPII